MGNIVNGIAGYFFNSFIDWLEEKILALAAFAISFINKYVLSFFDNEIIDAFMDFSTWINYFVFAVALVVAIVDIAEEKASDKPVYWSVVFTNTAKAFAFAGLARWIAILSMEISNDITTYFGISLDVDSFELNAERIVNSILGMESIHRALFSVIFLIVILFAAVFFAVSSLKRFGVMFVHIFTSALYIPDVLRGDTTKMGEWFRQMASIVLTYVFIYILFFLGASFFGGENLVPCLACWLAMPAVSKVLNRYGWTSGTQGNFGSIAVQAGMMAIR